MVHGRYDTNDYRLADWFLFCDRHELCRLLGHERAFCDYGRANASRHGHCQRPGYFCSGDSVALTAASGYAKYGWSSGDTTASISVKTSGIYSVTVTNAGGCSATSTPDTVTVSPVPELFISGPVAICP